MSTLRGLLDELVGLFVDDGRLALSLLLAVALAGVLVGLFHPSPLVSGPVLALGCLAALLASVQRAVRARKGR